MQQKKKWRRNEVQGKGKEDTALPRRKRIPHCPGGLMLVCVCPKWDVSLQQQSVREQMEVATERRPPPAVRRRAGMGAITRGTRAKGISEYRSIHSELLGKDLQEYILKNEALEPWPSPLPSSLLP